ncbi:sigma-70 family RNA polymerase sigma factor [Cytophagaceae bacterium DM2B3-1]|uniref:Sigma-70 family RNA polymerase sigma factor n=1 Tax=Xanthocytophaga flava TaxID=3048013 RepID=A0AAE3U5S0_9BACT|nr:sigma-70 family RNA polymerase sigma factor [Xanthocytophaga flavus]MDJ1468503.1 sigma-70 family RNA polymerase sigma factor [Xanthocytophaga flavus]MDJ1480571.1 sigma-70 family RNA polymerase sigma factor [Xanthocytophaga flavus]MDJ1493398.1 sigma-70 family RNA polymerase sigma factor [Xanthocytophaga flavus]
MDLLNFKQSVLPSKNKLFRFAKRFMGSSADAEDIVQDVFMRLWDIRERLDTYNSVEALAMQITKNMCLGKLRSKKNYFSSIEDHGDHVVTMPSTLLPDKKFELQDTKKLIEKIIEQLPATQRIVLQLRDIEEYELSEIAEIIQRDEAYVRVNLCRARKKLRETLIQLNIHGSY